MTLADQIKQMDRAKKITEVILGLLEAGSFPGELAAGVVASKNFLRALQTSYGKQLAALDQARIEEEHVRKEAEKPTE